MTQHFTRWKRAASSMSIAALISVGTLANAQQPGGIPKTDPLASYKPDMTPAGPPPTEVAAVATDAFSISVRWMRAAGSAGSTVYLSAYPDTGYRRIWKDSTPGPAAPSGNVMRAGGPAGSFSIPRAAPTPTPTTSGAATIDTRSPMYSGYQLTKLQPGTTFYVKVGSWYADGREGRSSAVTAVTLPPPAIANFKAVQQGNGATLTWDPVPNASAYRVIRNGQKVADITPGTYADGSTRLNTGFSETIPQGKTYSYVLQAVYTLYPFSPERIVTATGSVKVPWPPIVGIADTHAHVFANLAAGGLMFYGLPYGAPKDALAWCDSLHIHGPGGTLDFLGNAAAGRLGHLVGGYPQFDGWPRWNTLDHQQMYEDWLYRAVQGGLRLMVMHAVNNELLCSIVRKAPNRTCDDMEAVDLQLAAAKSMEQYIDNKFGGAGHGWFRIAYSPEQARQIIGQNKLAVVLGIEVDNLFGCHEGQCNAVLVDQKLDQYYRLGVRHLFPIHFANNAFGGFAVFDDLFNVNNKIVGSKQWVVIDDVTKCAQKGYEFRFGLGIPPGSGPLVAAIRSRLPEDARRDMEANGPPGYPASGAHCNSQGLTPLGAHLITAMMDRGMMIDIDHMSALTTDSVLSLTHARGYPVIGGHTGFVTTSRGGKKSEGQKTDAQMAAIKRDGGIVSVIVHQGELDDIATYTPSWRAAIPHDCGESSKTWVQSYLYAVDKMGGPDSAGVGLATDQFMNPWIGPRFGSDACPLSFLESVIHAVQSALGQTHPQTTPVTYPITSPVNGAQLGPSVFANRTFDYNTDGLAHVGLIPDFVQDLQNIGLTNRDLTPLLRSAEAYLQAWEQAVGRSLKP